MTLTTMTPEHLAELKVGDEVFLDVGNYDHVLELAKVESITKARVRIRRAGSSILEFDRRTGRQRPRPLGYRAGPKLVVADGAARHYAAVQLAKRRIYGLRAETLAKIPDERILAAAKALFGEDEHVLLLSKRQLDVAREALAAEATISEWSDADRATIEEVIAKLEELGARGSL